jgi:hypothetical protein
MNLEPLFIARTEETPEVDFNPETGSLKLSGRSLPEDAFSFYRPLIDWLRTYVQNLAPHTMVHINLDYFNSSSGRYLMEVFAIIDRECHHCADKINIVWSAEKDDEVMLEKGAEFKSLLNLPFHIQEF